MKIILSIFLFIFSISFSIGQSTTDYAVQTWAEIETSPAKITVHWKPVNGATQYQVYRKIKTGNSWGSSLATLDSSVSSFEDVEVIENVSYEYKIEKLGNVAGFGYINAGIEILPEHFKGNLLLLIDDSFVTSLEPEINQLKQDLVGDGWTVYSSTVHRDSSAAFVKQLILDQDAALLNKLDALFCLGRVPVPYSGNYAADGHTNNHEGAWPSDTYYADLDGTWTDVTANNVTASQTRTHNIPGDGKFDQSFLPSDVELQIGRVDFSNMPAFAQSEEELLRQYLQKNHAYKMGEIKVQMKAIIDDNFGGFNGEAFAASGWKSFAPLIHPDNVKSEDYRTAMDTASYIWSYGCGGGSYTSCSGVGTTNAIAEDSLQGVFSALFGSYFGDWDASNNLMRATLAQGTILTNCWSGRPHWYFHHMGLGENIGYSTKVSMNNTTTRYFTPLGFLARFSGMGLMGDPSLRMYVLTPPSNLVATFDGEDMQLEWTASTDPGVGYYVYEYDSVSNAYFLRNDEPIFTTNFNIECAPIEGLNSYMVRATKLTNTPSGSFHNLSTGIFATEEINLNLPTADFTISINNGELTTENLSINSTNWLWDFGDGSMISTEFEPTHTYTNSGTFEVLLVAGNNCFTEEFETSVTITISKTANLITDAGISIYPNPMTDVFKIESEIPLTGAEVLIYDSFGRLKLQQKFSDGVIDFRSHPDLFSSGIHFIRINHEGKSGVLRLVKM